jgi:hypothetical protein
LNGVFSTMRYVPAVQSNRTHPEEKRFMEFCAVASELAAGEKGKAGVNREGDGARAFLQTEGGWN